MSKTLFIIALLVAISIIPIGAIFQNTWLDIGLGAFAMLLFIIHMKTKSNSEYESREKEPTYEQEGNVIEQPEEPEVLGIRKRTKAKVRKKEEESGGSGFPFIGTFIGVAVAIIVGVGVVIPVINNQVTNMTNSVELGNSTSITSSVSTLLSIVPILMVLAIIISVVGMVGRFGSGV